MDAFPLLGRLLPFMKRQADKAASRCEPKLRFSSTPVYDVTLAEDLTTDSNNPIVIFDNEKAGIVKFGMIMPAASSAGGITFKITLNTNEIIEITNGSSFNPSGRNTFVDFSVIAGMLNVTTGNSNGTAMAWDKFERFFYPRYFGSYIKKIYFYATTGIAIPAGTKISCYLAKEVEQ